MNALTEYQQLLQQYDKLLDQPQGSLLVLPLVPRMAAIAKTFERQGQPDKRILDMQKALYAKRIGT